MTRRNVSTDGPDPIDVHVGNRIRLRRTILGMSQQKLGEALGVSFQQMQKREKGTNRCGASILFRTARVLDVPVSFFFDDMPKDLREVKEAAPEVAYHGHRADRSALEVMRHYPNLSAGIRRAILTIARESAQAADGGVMGAPSIDDDTHPLHHVAAEAN